MDLHRRGMLAGRVRLRRRPATSPRPTASASLTFDRRAAELAAAVGGEPVDLLVIGGGITGVGAALDAASRGLRTVLIESRDLAFGTSRWSSKLVHGGLRYLASGDVPLAYECAVERGHLISHIAPHLVHSAPMMLPLLPAMGKQQAALSTAGLFAADLLRRAAGTPSRTLPRPRILSAAAAGQQVSGLPGMRGALEFHDGQLTDDARLVVGVARTAATHGASILTHVRACGIEAGGVTVVDEFTGESGVIRARAVVNATGVWAAQLAPELVLRPSRGTHVVLDGDALPGLRTNLMLAIPGAHNRYLLVLPQLGGRLYLGLTDEPIDIIEDVPVPPQPEIDELTGILGDAMGRPIDQAHIVGAYAGLRPMLADGTATATSDLSRRHRVVLGEHSAVHVVGGKLTTYRRMAKDAVDAAVDHTGLPAGPCVTATLPLVGAASPARLAARPEPATQVARFGTEAAAVAALERSDPRLAAQIAPGVPVTGAELLFAALHEGAHSVDDLLDRRFRIGLVPVDRAASVPAAQAAIDRAAERSAEHR